MSAEAAERETVITWSDADNGTATVYTVQRPMVTLLQKVRGAERLEVHRTEAGAWTGETWRVPVAYVQVRPPKRLSEAHRERLRVLSQHRGFGARNLSHTLTPRTKDGGSSVGPGLAHDHSVQAPVEDRQ
ncbi:MAG TPA: hypothetical protein VJT33_03505 [bacterium]|nr:hypothetical protein [bacterium]